MLEYTYYTDDVDYLRHFREGNIFSSIVHNLWLVNDHRQYVFLDDHHLQGQWLAQKASSISSR